MDGERKVWAPDVREGFCLGKITDIGSETISVELLDNGKVVTAPYSRVFPAEDDVNHHVDDNCSLMYLNEATLLHNLKLRYKKDIIYTYVANILIAVNPYHEVGHLYSKESIQKYKGKSLGVLPPHVFAIADKAYRDMKVLKQSQSIIVSGESGAGKTESTKFILRYVVETVGSGGGGHIEQRIVEANPLLESFGNAKTLRNLNSSRFGKYVEVHFNDKAQVAGGYISHYLLEKSRVCKQGKGERNYHIFYRICAGAPPEMRKALRLSEPKTYSYLNKGAITDPNLDDAADFKRLEVAMKAVGLSEEEKCNIYRVVAAVLHLGNIEFEENLSDKKGGSQVTASSEGVAADVAKLLGVEPLELKMSLATRVMTTTKGGNMGTLYKIPLKVEQACAARDALAKAIYSKLFDHIVSCVNQCFPFKSSTSYIGVLDIAGFEFFEVNSFEQFCINYCNEKLQQFFNQRILKEEQALYDKEGLGVKNVAFVDNQDCIDLIEGKGIGILDLLNEESKLPKPSEEHFTADVHQKQAKHFRLALPRKSPLRAHRNLRDDQGFMIRHFAGAVCYQTTQLGLLMEKLRNTGSNFIRCIKPNDEMKSKDFEGGQILSQLECAGMVSVLELMQEGYPSRTSFSDLYNKYKSTLPPKLAKLNPRTFCQALFRVVGIGTDDFKFGMTKVFFRPGKFAEFDQLMRSDPDTLNALIAKVQRWIICNRWKRAIWGAVSVQKLANKIKYRQAMLIKIQKTVRRFLAIQKHRPRYKGIMKVRKLHVQIEQMRQLAAQLKSDKDKITKQVAELESELEGIIKKIKTTMMKSGQIDALYNDLYNKMNNQVNQFKKRKEVEKEQERLRKIQEEMELERKRREEEERKKREEEEQRKLKAEMEAKAKKEAEEAERKRKEEEEANRKLLEKLKTEHEAVERERGMREEQERRDYEIALRLATEGTAAFRQAQDISSVNAEESEPSRGGSVKRSDDKKLDLRSWKYAELRDTINTSTDIELLEVCREEFHRRLKVYHAWRKKNAERKQAAASQQRAPVDVIHNAEQMVRLPPPPQKAQVQKKNRSSSHRAQRFFRVAFARPADQYRDKEYRKHGWWYAHFDGEWVARQLEVHPNGVLLLVAGRDDMDMCELSLRETGLTQRRGAEISRQEFEVEWKRHGGTAVNVTAKQRK